MNAAASEREHLQIVLMTKRTCDRICMILTPLTTFGMPF